jgi:hypothetical protein
MMWFLAVKMEMSTVPENEIEVLAEGAPGTASAPR